MIRKFTSAQECEKAWKAFISKDNEVANNLSTRILSYCPREKADLLDKKILMACHRAENGRGTGFAFMMPPHRLVLSVPYPDEFESLVNRLIENDIVIPGVVAEKECGIEFANNWVEKNGKFFKIGHEMTIYELRTEAQFPVKTPLGSCRIANDQDREQLADWMVQFEIDANISIKTSNPGELVEQLIKKEEIFIWENQEKGMMGCARRLSLGSDGCCVNFVYTPKSMRNHGVASQLVAEISQDFLNRFPSGYCCLFTDNANPTSNSIYKKIGYQEKAQFVEIDFLEALEDNQ